MTRCTVLVPLWQLVPPHIGLGMTRLAGSRCRQPVVRVVTITAWVLHRGIRMKVNDCSVLGARFLGQLFLVTPQAVTPRRHQGGLRRKEVVAVGAVQSAHPCNLDGFPCMTFSTQLDGRTKPMNALRMTPDARDLLLPCVYVVTCRVGNLDPLIVTAAMALGTAIRRHISVLPHLSGTSGYR